jgi:hypothetical protein
VSIQRPTDDRSFHHEEGSAHPDNVHAIRVNEINTNRYAAGSRGGTTAGQGPALESK